MSTEEACKASTYQDSLADGIENTSAQAVTGMNPKSGKQLAHTIRATAGKNDSRYWLPRVFRPVNARGEASPHYSMKVQFRGRRMAFTLNTANKDAAAKRAAAIYGELVAHGIEATLARHRAQRPAGEDVATIGEYLFAAQSVMAVRPPALPRMPPTCGGSRVTSSTCARPGEQRPSRSGQRGRPSRTRRFPF